MYDTKKEQKTDEALLEAEIDNIAVDEFAKAMKEKLAKARAKGRSGWDNKDTCSDERLVYLFFKHLKKANDGNFVDLANFLMFLYMRDTNPDVLNSVKDLFKVDFEADTEAMKHKLFLSPENIIAKIRNSFYHATVVYTRGSCGQLYKILKEIFPDAEAYENGDHVITKIGYTFYDIHGKVSQRLLQDFKPCQADNKMLSHRFGNDLQHIQCPNCDEVFYCGDEDEKDNA